MPSAKTPARSRRNEHKSRTHDAIREAALDLFASQGYDETTTEEIAEKAGVAARTFFRYFPTKESVLYLREREWFDSFTADFLAKPMSMTDVDAMRETYVAAAPRIAQVRRQVLLYEKAVASSPTLRGRRLDHQVDDAKSVAQAIATRRGSEQPDESMELLAWVGLLTHRRALDRWLAGSARANLGNAIREEFEVLAGLFR